MRSRQKNNGYTDIPDDVIASMSPDGCTASWLCDRLGLKVGEAGALLKKAGFKAYGTRWRKHPKVGEPK